MKLQKKGLRVLIYSDHFFPSIGGSENYAIDLATELTSQGHCVGVITSEREQERDSFSFKMFRLRKPFSLHRINLNFIEIPEIVKQFRPDIFHINYQTGGENFLIPLLYFMKVPFVITYHGDHVVIAGKIIDEVQLASTFKCARMIMVQSDRDQRKFKMRGIRGEKLSLIRFNGINTKKFKCGSDRLFNGDLIKLLCIARLDDSHKYKGVHELIESIKESQHQIFPFKLILNIIGDGNLRKEYEEECEASNLNNVAFLGDLSSENLLIQLCDANFLILPSIDKAEGFGRVALEALSCGTPVIVSKYAGISELIRKYGAGIVYDPGKRENLIVNLDKILHNPKRIQQFVENGKRLVLEESLSISDTTNRVLEIYYHALGTRMS